MCNQHAGAARMTILNATIKDFHLKANNWHDHLQATMQDQLNLQVVNEEPPPYQADPCVLEWIARHAKDGKIVAEAHALEVTIKDAQDVYHA